MGDNVLSPDRASVVVGIMVGYDIDVSKIMDREIRDWVVNTDTTLTFSSLLTQIFQEGGVPKILVKISY